MTERCADRQQLVDAMCAAVAPGDCGAATVGQISSQPRVAAQCGKVLSHLDTIPRKEVIIAGGEEVLAIIPRCRYQRRPAGERFEHPDRGDTGPPQRVAP